jgi:hypothetical protein
MKKVIALIAVLSVVVFNCSKKTTTNNYYYDGPQEGGAIVGVVHPPESRAQVTAYMGIPIASIEIDSVGYFKLSGLPAGTYSLLVQADGYNDYTSKPNVAVTAGATATVDTIHLTSVHELIYSVNPYDGEQDVRITRTIGLRFRRLMDTESVEQAFHLVPTVEGSFRWYSHSPSASHELQFTPRERLATNTWYEVTIDATASDTAGIALSEPYTFSFTTELLRVDYTSPSNNHTWIPPKTNVLITFNDDMDMGSAGSAFKMVDSELTEVAGFFVYRSSRQMNFHPNSVLAVSEKYTVTVDTSAMDTRGGRLSEPYSFSFTTQPIRIEHTSPQHKESWVSTSVRVLINFNTDMDMESVNSAFQMVDTELEDVPGELAWYYPSYLEFRPDSPLAPDEVYTVTVAADAADTYGSTLGDPYSFWFKTQP